MEIFGNSGEKMKINTLSIQFQTLLFLCSECVKYKPFHGSSTSCKISFNFYLLFKKPQGIVSS